MDKLYRLVDQVTLESEGSAPVIRGRAIVYNALSEDMGGFRERMRPGAFDDSLTNGDQFAYIDHNHSLILGRKSAGTLKFSNEPDGVYVAIYPADTTYAKDLLTNMKAGNIDKMSFGIMLPKHEVVTEGGQVIVDTVAGIVHEFSVVTEPAFAQTMAMVEHGRQEIVKTYSLYQAQQHKPDWQLASLRRKLELVKVQRS